MFLMSPHSDSGEEDARKGLSGAAAQGWEEPAGLGSRIEFARSEDPAEPGWLVGWVHRVPCAPESACQPFSPSSALVLCFLQLCGKVTF